MNERRDNGPLTSGSRRSRRQLSVAACLSAVAAGVLASGAAAATDEEAMLAALTEALEPAKPIEPTEALIERVVAARKGFGFRSDPDYVRELLTRPERFGAVVGPLTGGHHATPEEVEELRVRTLVQEDALSILPRASEDSAFAGLYVGRDGVLNVGFVADAEERLEKLREGANVPKRIRAFTAERTLAELEERKVDVVGSIEKLVAEGLGISEVAIDVAGNTLRVGVVDLDPRKREAIVALFGRVEVVDKPLNLPDDRSDTASPMRAGVRITNQSGGSCTSNWKARDRDTNALVTLTAGHCAPDVDGTLGGPGASTFQGFNPDFTSRLVGVSDRTTWLFPAVNPATGARSGAAPVDAMRTPLGRTGSLPWLYAYDDANNGVFDNGEQVPVGDADGTVAVGTTVCSAGQFSPANQVGGDFKNCGTVSAVNVANVFARQPGSPDRFTLLNSNVADYVAISGDSGAPVWRLAYVSGSGFETVAVGHHTGGPTGSEVFNDIDRVEDALNVDIVHF